MEKLFDPIRKEWVAATPEEKVRQSWLLHMVEVLGYPASLIAIEKELRAFSPPSLKPPNRRLDAVVFGKRQEGGLFPLLLMECKAVNLTDRALRQVASYNEYVQARYIALVNAEEAWLGRWNAQHAHYDFLLGLPPYSVLVSQI